MKHRSYRRYGKRLGDFSSVGPGAHLPGNVVIGNRSELGLHLDTSAKSATRSKELSTQIQHVFGVFRKNPSAMLVVAGFRPLIVRVRRLRLKGNTRMEAAVFLAQLEELFEVDAGILELSTALEDIPAWGSLSFLGLIAMVDDEYQVTLPPKRVLACHSLQDLMSAVHALLPAERRAA